MMRRLFTILSVASLVLCMTACYFWWRSARDGIGVVELRAAGAYVRLSGHAEAVELTTIGRWPGPAAAQVAWGRDEADAMPGIGLSYNALTDRRVWRLLGLAGERGRVNVLLGEDGAPRDVNAASGRERGRPSGRWSDRLPYASVIDAPPWLPAAATAALPTAWLLARGSAALRRRRRSAAGRCPACGYDVRATPDRCPECGAAPGTKGNP